MSEKAQRIIIWWGLVFMVLFFGTLLVLMHMLPPPPADLSEAAVAAFYRENAFEIKLGAVIMSWVSAYNLPINVVIAIQLARLEKGRVPAWSILAFAGGILMSMFLVFPPICWGVAAFTVERAPAITTIMHELGTLTLVTTDQFYIFQMVAIGVVSLSIKEHDELSAFPRWLGYLILWVAAAFEVGAVAFLFKTGPFAWDGLLVFWMPVILTGVWLPVTCYVMLRALKRQEAAAADAQLAT